MLSPSQISKDNLGDRNWWRLNGLRSLSWFNANIMPFAWDDKFQDFGHMHQVICDHLDPAINRNPQIYLSAFRGSHKTTQLLGFICWFLVRNLVRKSSNALVYNTATKENTFNMQADVRHSLLYNPVIHWAYPEVPDEEKKFDDMTKPRIQHKQVKLDFTSLETTLVSRHYPVWINDDLENDENCRTEYMREALKTKWKYQKAILTKIKSRGVGLEIEVGTPYSVNGLTWMIRNLPRYSKVEIPCYIGGEKRNGVWFPELYAVEDFEAKLEEMGTTLFSAQYLLKPLSEEDALCPEGWIRRWTALPELRWRSMVIDPALSASPGSDATGITIVDTDENGTIFIVFADEFFVTPDKLIDTIVALKNRFDPDDIRIEKVAYSTTIADTWVHRYPDLNISFVEHKGRAKGDKKNRDVMNTRIWRLKQWFETRRILLPPLGQYPLFEKQLVEYPDSRRDDMLDSLAYHLDIRMIPRRKGKMILPSGREFVPNINESFDKEYDSFLERREAMREERYQDGYF